MARTNTIEVVIKGDDQASKPIGGVSKALGGLGTAASDASGPLNRFGGFLRNTLSTASGFIAANVIGDLAGRVAGFGRALVGTNADMETYITAFETLLGSTEAATARLEEITEFAKITPFNLEDVIQANKILTVFGEGVLDTTEVMTLVGDAAAAANTNFAELSTWVGRAYSNIQAGKPFGEAAMRLQELGLMTGEQRLRLEELTEAGADSNEIWAEFTKGLGKFSGLMSKQSATFKGITSNIEDVGEALIRTLGKPIFDFVKRSAQGFLTFLESDFVQDGVVRAAAAIERFLNWVSRIKDAFVDLLRAPLRQAADLVNIFFDGFQGQTIGSTISTLQTQVSALGARLREVVDLVNIFFDGFQGQTIGSTIPTLQTQVSALGARLREVVDFLRLDFLRENAEQLRSVLESVGKALLTLLAAQKVIGFIKGLVGVFQLLMGVLSPVNLAIAALTAVFYAFDQNLFGIRDTLESVVSYIKEAFGPAIEEIGKKLAAGDLGGAISGFVKLIGDVASDIGENVSVWAKEFLDNFLPTVPELLDKLTELINSFFGFVEGNTGDIGKSAAAWADRFLENLFPSIAAVGDRVLRLAGQVGAWLIETGGLIATKATAWAASLLDNVVPRIPDILARLSELFNSLLDSVEREASRLGRSLEGWKNTFLENIVPNLGRIGERIGELVLAIGDWISREVPRLVNRLSEWAQAFLQWVGPMVRELLPKLGEAIGNVANWLISEGVPKLLEWVGNLISGVGPALQGFIEELWRFLTESLIPGLLDMGVEIAEGIWEGLSELGPILMVEIPKAFDNIRGGIEDWIQNELPKVGPNLINGINELLDPIKNAVNDFLDKKLRPAWEKFWGPSGPIGAALRNALAGILEAVADIEESINEFLLYHQLGGVEGFESEFRRRADELRAEAEGLKNDTINIFDAMGNTVNRIANSSFGKTVSDIARHARTMTANINIEKTKTVTIFDALGGTINRIANSSFGQALTGIVDRVKMAAPAFLNMKDKVSNAVQGAGNVLSRIFKVNVPSAMKETEAGAANVASAYNNAASVTQNAALNMAAANQAAAQAATQMGSQISNSVGQMANQVQASINQMNNNVQVGLADMARRTQESIGVLSDRLQFSIGALVPQIAGTTGAVKSVENWLMQLPQINAGVWHTHGAVQELKALVNGPVLQSLDVIAVYLMNMLARMSGGGPSAGASNATFLRMERSLQSLVMLVQTIGRFLVTGRVGTGAAAQTVTPSVGSTNIGTQINNAGGTINNQYVLNLTVTQEEAADVQQSFRLLEAANTP